MSKYKLYLHFEGSPALTYIYKSSRDCEYTVRQLLEEFCSKYSQKHGKHPPAANLQLVNDVGKRPDIDNQVVKAFSNGSDVQVNSTSEADHKASSGSPDASDTTPNAGERLEQLAADLQLSSGGQHASQLAGKDHNARDDNTDVTNSAVASFELFNQNDGTVYLPIIKQFLERAKEAESKKYFRAACKIYEQVTGGCHAVKICVSLGAASNLGNFRRC